jgi:hypothetical protein
MSVGHIKPKVVTHGNNFCEDGLLLSTHFRNFKSSICTGPRSFATGRPLSTRGSARSAKMPKKKLLKGICKLFANLPLSRYLNIFSRDKYQIFFVPLFVFLLAFLANSCNFRM